jgi:hypothetical protein
LKLEQQSAENKTPKKIYKEVDAILFFFFFKNKKKGEIYRD